MGSFTPLVFGTNGGMGADCNCFLKRLAEKLSEKNEEPYHITCKRQECFPLPLQYFYVRRVLSYFRVRAFSAVVWLISFSLSAQLCPSCQDFSAYRIFSFYCNFFASVLRLAALGPVYSLMFGFCSSQFFVLISLSSCKYLVCFIRISRLPYCFRSVCRLFYLDFVFV